MLLGYSLLLFFVFVGGIVCLGRIYVNCFCCAVWKVCVVQIFGYIYVVKFIIGIVVCVCFVRLVRKFVWLVRVSIVVCCVVVGVFWFVWWVCGY